MLEAGFFSLRASAYMLLLLLGDCNTLLITRLEQ
jgi:hypothetical protein